jgi:uncharacterized phage protein (TIGR02218 family)
VARTLTAGMQAMLAGTSHSRCSMLLMELQDGTVLGMTDHDKDISYDLTDAGLGEVVYEAGAGILRSEVSLMAGLDADNFEVEGPITETVTLEAILGGRFNRARVWLFEVDWKDTTNGAIKLLAGNVTDAKPKGGRFVFEIRSDFDRYNQIVGEVLTPMCKVDFGSVKCGVTPEEITGTVISVTDSLDFVVSFAGSYADGYFNLGVVVPETGANAGGQQIEVFAWYATGQVLLFAQLASTPEVGDTFTIRRGCSKLRKSDDATIPTCLTYGNVVNFRGYPEMPGSDKILKATIPGQGDDG